MVIPSKIEVSFSPRPKLLDVAKDFMDEFSLQAEDNPEGYMFYYPPSPVEHTYTITATSNGHPVEDFTLYVEDEISMMTDDAPEEQMMEVIGEEAEFTVKGGLPKTTDDAPPLAAPKRVTFRVVKDGYEDSAPVEDEVIVLGDVPVGTAAKIVAIPDINYTVLHDPPGDGSYSYLDDTVTLRGFVKDMQIEVDEYGMENVDVYPSHWDSVKEIEDWDDADKNDDLEDKGLLGHRDAENMTGYFIAGSVLEVGTQASSIFVPGALGWFFRFAKLGTSISKFATGGAVLPGVNFVQYEISADTRLQTPSGDSLPDILGPGKGDIYFGEGWTLGLQTKYRLGIECLEREPGDGPCLEWQLTTEEIETYDILDRGNQYIYTTRDIDNIIVDLDKAIQNADDPDEKQRLEWNKGDWEKLLNNNLAYVWNKDYVPQGKSFDDFLEDHDELAYSNGKAKGETLIFSAGPSFEYSRTISEGDFYTYRANLSVGSHTSMKGQLVYSAGTWAFGNGVLQYYQLASDIHMTSDHSLISEWEDGTGERSRYFRLDVQKVGFVAGTFQKGTSGWKFFSVPISPQRAEPFVNLGDDIDPFKLFQYDTGLSGYKIYPFDIGEVGLQTGHGYFTRLQENVDVDVGGSSNQDDVTLDLEAEGWHPIGNPFIKEVDVASLIVNDGTTDRTFDDAVTAELVEGTLYRWNIVTDNAAFLSDVAISDSYEAVTSGDQLNPWDACWLKTNQVDLTLKIPAPADLPDSPPMPDYLKPPMAPVGHAAEVRDFGYPLVGQFDLKLALISDFASDLTTTLGTHQNAKVGRDVFDQSEPPTLSKTVAAYFAHPDWGDDTALKNGAGGLYNRDYQPALKVGEQRTWKFTVYTDKQDAEMTLSWEKAIAQVPGDLMLYFRRGDGQSDWQDMREVQSVDLISHERITEIPFEVRAQRFEMSPLSDVQVVAGEKQVLLRWGSGVAQSRHDNEFISGYTITRKVAEFARIRGNARTLASSATYSLEPGANQFLDTNVIEEATYIYQVTVHFKSGAELQSELLTITVLPVIKKTALLQSYPNPFNPDVWIPYELKKESPVTIEIYNAAGQLVRTLELGEQPRGRYISKSKAAYWNGRSESGERAASGLYFYVLKAGDFVATGKMAVLK